MKRFSVWFSDNTFQLVWAENKRAARKQMSLYAAYRRTKITEVV